MPAPRSCTSARPRAATVGEGSVSPRRMVGNTAVRHSGFLRKAC